MRRAALFGALLALCHAAPARAEDALGSRSIAVQLFDSAETLAKSGNFAEACPKYAESYRRDPQLGVLLYLAECYEKNAQLASAWTSFREARELAEKRGDERALLAAERAVALEPRLSRLKLEVSPAARVPGLVLRRGGAALDESLWGEPLAVDAGTHRVSAEAPGRQAFSVEVRVSEEGQLQTISIPQLAEAPPPPVAAPAVAAAPRVAAQPPPAAPRGSTQRIAAVALGGAGLVGLGVSGFFGLRAQSSYDDAVPHCGRKDACTQAGVNLRETAQSQALAATFAGVLGAAALVGAGVLWLTAPSPKEAASRGGQPAHLSLASDGSGLRAQLAGSF